MNDEECEIMEANRKAWKDEEDEDWRTREAQRKDLEAYVKDIEKDQVARDESKRQNQDIKDELICVFGSIVLVGIISLVMFFAGTCARVLYDILLGD